MIKKPAGYKLMIDCAGGDNHIDYKTIAAAGVDIVCFRGGRIGVDAMAHTHCLGAVDAGMQVASYWYIQLGGDTGTQSDRWRKLIDGIRDTISKAGHGLDLQFLAPDIEQEKGQYKALINGKSKTKSGKYPPGIINNGAWSFTEYIKRWAGDIPIWPYFRRSYIGEYCSELAKWIYKYPSWISRPLYIQNPSGDWGDYVVTCDRQEASAKNFIYCPTWDEYFERYAPTPDNQIEIAHDFQTGMAAWQFSIDRVKLPGCGSFMDLNWVKESALGEVMPMTA